MEAELEEEREGEEGEGREVSSSPFGRNNGKDEAKTRRKIVDTDQMGHLGYTARC